MVASTENSFFGLLKQRLAQTMARHAGSAPSNACFSPSALSVPGGEKETSLALNNELCTPPTREETVARCARAPSVIA